MSSKSRRKPQPRPSTPRSGNPARRQAQEPAAPPARRTLERFSAPVLIRLHAMPRWFVPVLLAVALFAGLALPAQTAWAWLGAALLLVVGLFVAWLTALSWPILTPSARIVRAITAVVLVGLSVYKAMGRF